MPSSKKVYVREHTVRAHERVIYSRIYLFICQDCNQDVRRETFGGRPIYCEKCRPSQAKKNEWNSSKKRPRPVLVEVDKATLDNGRGKNLIKTSEASVGGSVVLRADAKNIIQPC